MRLAFFLLIALSTLSMVSGNLETQEVPISNLNCNQAFDPLREVCSGSADDVFNVSRPVIVLEFPEGEGVEIENYRLVSSTGSPEVLMDGSDLEFEFTPEFALGDGEYTLFVDSLYTVRNYPVIVNVSFNIDADQMRIWVNEPSHDLFEEMTFAFSNQDNFYLELGLEEPAECKYDFIVASGASIKQLFDDNQLRNTFSHPEGYEYAFVEEFSISDVSLTPENSRSIQVVCREINSGRYSAESIEVGVFQNPPVITGFVEPNPIVDGVNRRFKLDVTSSEVSACFFDSEDEYLLRNIIRTPGFIYTSYAQLSTRFVEVSSIEFNQTYEVNVSCVGQSNLWSSEVFEIRADFENFQYVTFHNPGRFSKDSSVTLNISTVFPDECQYSVNDDSDFSSSLTLQDSFNNIHTASGVRLTEQGYNDIYVFCDLMSSPESHRVFLDTTPPVNTTLFLDDYSCSVSSVSFSVSAEDNQSGLSHYLYNVTPVSNEFDGYVSGQSSTGRVNVNFRDITREDLEGESVNVRVRAVDNAGNLGSEISRNIVVSNSSIPSCDFTPPEGRVVVRDQAGTNYKDAYIYCVDDHSGCDQYARYSMVMFNESCTYNNQVLLNTSVEVRHTTKFCYAVFDKNDNNDTGYVDIEIDYPPHCFNNILDGDETDVDCGGSCPACDLGFSCSIDEDCGNGYCVDGTCESEPDCTDRCGGPCGPCEVGLSCEVDSDCLSGNCLDGVCADPSCDNNKRDGFETDVDCGGPDCPACALGDRCEVDSDCLSGYCGDNGRCAVPKAEQLDDSEFAEESSVWGLVFLILAILLLLTGGGLVYYDTLIPRRSKTSSIAGPSFSPVKQVEQPKEESPEVKKRRELARKKAVEERLRKRKEMFGEFSKKPKTDSLKSNLNDSDNKGSKDSKQDSDKNQSQDSEKKEQDKKVEKKQQEDSEKKEREKKQQEDSEQKEKERKEIEKKEQEKKEREKKKLKDGDVLEHEDDVFNKLKDIAGGKK